MPKPHFVVDKKGLAALLERRGREFAVLELIQNALDEPSVSRIEVRLEPTKTRGYHRLYVEDDAPEGFYDLSHAFTLFKDNRKRTQAEKRGRFNMGEKLVVALCKTASIITTTGGVAWNSDGRRSLRARTKEGSWFTGVIRMNKDEAERAIKAARQVILPALCKMVVNGQPLLHRTAINTLETTLPTEVADADGLMKTTRRKTSVKIIEPLESEEPMLYEMGIPVVESGLPWHVDIGQRVPLPMDRDNVSPAYARKLRAAVLNVMHEKLPVEEASAGWVKDALGSGELSGEAVNTTITKLYGDKRVIRDPSDPEANNKASSLGYAIMEPRSFNKEQWDVIKNAEAAKPAGQVTPSGKPQLGGDLDTRYPKSKWTKDMFVVVNFMEKVGSELLLQSIRVDIVKDKANWNYGAWYSQGELTLNLQSLGHKFFHNAVSNEVVFLLLHEIAHHYSSDHLSRKYHDALTRLGTKLGKLALKNPEFLKEWK